MKYTYFVSNDVEKSRIGMPGSFNFKITMVLGRNTIITHTNYLANGQLEYYEMYCITYH